MSLLDTIKDTLELAKKGITIDLQERLMKLREEALALQDENLALKVRVSDLEAQMAESSSLSFDGVVYWKARQEADREGPYCQRCHDADKKLIRLQSSPRYDLAREVGVTWHCKACRASYDSK